MGWLDDVGDFFETTGKQIGSAYDAATDNAFGDVVRSGEFFGRREDGSLGVKTPFEPVTGPVLSAGVDVGSKALDVISWPGEQVQRGFTTALLAGDLPGGPFDVRSWSDAWDIADRVGPGDVLFAPSVSTLTNPAEYERWKGTWSSRLTAGATNFLSEWFLDPVAGAAGIASDVNQASKTLRGATETRNIMRVAAGEANKAQVSRREWRFGQKFQQYLDATDGKSASELMDTPMFQDMPDGGALAYLFERANKSYAGDTKKAQDARRSIKRDLLGAAMGDVGSIQRLGGRQDAMANELYRLGERPEPTRFAEKFSWDDHGQGALFEANKRSDPAVEAARDGIEAEITRMNRVVEQQGTVSRIPTTRGLKESTLYFGMANRPVHVVSGQLHDSGSSLLRPRVSGFVSTKDVTTGYRQLSEYMKQSRYVDPAVKKDILDRYVRAATPGERHGIVEESEKRMFEAYSKKYGLSREEAETFLKSAQGRRGAYLRLCSDRLYSAAPDAQYIQVVDPEDSITKVVARPLMVSQVEDSAPLTNPAVLEKALKRNVSSGAIQAFTARTGLRKAAQDVEDFASDGMLALTRAWKDLALFRPAYPLRVQVDTQARLMTAMGALPYLQSLPGAVRGQLHYLLSRKGEAGLGLKNFFREGDLVGAVMKSRGRRGRGDVFADDEDAAKFLRLAAGEPGGMADLAGSVAVDDLRSLRGTGSWGWSERNSPNWLENWHRAVDRQVVNSPTAVKILQEPDDAAVKAWTLADPAGQNEWLNMRSSWDTREQWIDSLRSAVDYLVPTPELKDFVLKRFPKRLEAGDVETAAYAVGRRLELAQDVTSKTGAAQVTREDLDALSRTVRSIRADLDRQRATVRKLKESGAPDSELGSAIAERDSLARSWRSAIRLRTDAKRRAVETRRGAVATEKQAAGATSAARQRVAEHPEGWTAQQVDEYFSDQTNRMPVHGESYLTTVRGPMTARIEKFRKSWYWFASDAPETILGRSPLYRHRFNERVRSQLDQLGREKTELAPEEWDRVRKNAAIQARRDIKKVLFDTSDVSNLATHARFVSPFFAAWEDTMKKWGKLLWENPRAGVRMSNLLPATRSTGAVVDSEGHRIDDQGRVWGADGKQITDKDYEGYGEFVIIPNAFKPLGVPAQDVRINMKSANIIFQGEPWWLPGYGPTVQIPANAVVRAAFPDKAEDPIIKHILPYGVTDDPAAVQALPSWARQARNAFGNTRDYANTYTRLYEVERVKRELGQRSTDPTPKEIANKTRLWFVMRAVTAANSPVTAAPTPEFQFYVDRFKDLQRERAKDPEAWDKSHDGMSAQEVFYDKYPDYFDLTVSLSANTTGIEASQEAWRESTKPWVRRLTATDPAYGWMFTGAQNLAGGFDGSIYTAQQAEQIGYGSTKTFRGAREPAEAIRSVEAERGWIEYSRAREIVDQAMAGRGLYSLQAKGAEDIKKAWDEFTRGLSSENPSWAEEKAKDVDKVAELAAVARRAAGDSKQFAAREDYKILDVYMQARALVKEHLSGQKYSSLDRNPGVQEAWDEFVAALVASNLGFKQMYDRVLERDDLTTKVVW